MEKGMKWLRPETAAKWIGGLAGLTLSALGGWDLPLQVLVTAMALDYLSGILCAVKEKNLSSSVGFAGLMRKMMVLVVIALACALDALAGTGSSMRSAAAAFYTANEALSVLENAARLGLPVPEALTKRLAQVREEEEQI